MKWKSCTLICLKCSYLGFLTINLFYCFYVQGFYWTLLFFYHHKYLCQIHSVGSFPSVIVLIMFFSGEPWFKFQLFLQFGLAVVMCVWLWDAVMAVFGPVPPRGVSDGRECYFSWCSTSSWSTCADSSSWPLRVCPSFPKVVSCLFEHSLACRVLQKRAKMWLRVSNTCPKLSRALRSISEDAVTFLLQLWERWLWQLGSFSSLWA